MDVEADITKAVTGATLAVGATAGVAGAWRFADKAIVVVFAGKQLRYSLIKASEAICTNTS